MGASLSAAPIVAPEAFRASADSLNMVERAQFVWLGRQYCWYDDGWQGPGWCHRAMNTPRLWASKIP